MTDTFILQELITDGTPFRVHNVKIEKLICERDLPMMFLAHYDSLSDDIKADKPLAMFLKHSTQKMTSQEAAKLLGLPTNIIKPATHIKIIGTTVLLWEEFPLALHLQFTNTAKEFQTHYGNDTMASMQKEASNFAFSGNVHVLHKTPTKMLISIDLSDDEFTITPNETYTRLPNNHSLATTQLLNIAKDKSPQYLADLTKSITTKVLDSFDISKP